MGFAWSWGVQMIIVSALRSVEPIGSANAARWRGRDIGAVAGVALTMSLFAAGGAQAQNCTIPATNIVNLGAIGSSPASVSSMIGGTITAAETAFLLQSTAFVSSPPNPAADQQGGGIWVRGVGGTVDIKSSTSTGVSSTGAPPGVPAASATVPCTQKVDESFAGVQFGADTAKLNVNSWNFHLGTTAGFLGASGTLAQGAFAYLDPASIPASPAGGGPFTSNTQIPFIGEYAVATNGGFAIDALLRTEYYQNTLNAPGSGLFNQPMDARGISFSSSATYQWQVPDSKWFIEPSAGVIISRVKVDSFNFQTSGIFVPANDHIGGTLQLNDIKSDIGRVGLRAGTTIDTGNVIWQPFAAVSVWHEFGPNLTSNYSTCAGCAVIFGVAPTTITASSSTTTFGTYGQYSLGISAALAGTGWLGFARVDYRDGPNLQGLSGTGGIRYQFTPDMAVASRAMPVKAPVYKAPVVTAVNWTGFYIGGFGGATQGKADWGYAGGEVSPHVGSYLAGGDLGYSYQTGPYVFGVEFDIAKTHTNGATACGQFSLSPAGGLSPMFQMTCNAWADWVATATARAGYTWDRALFYVKGGGAWTNEQFSATCNFGPLNAYFLANNFENCRNPAGAFSNGFTASSGRDGWTIGTGTEFALTPNWSAKAEADYVSFGDTTVTASDGSPLKVGMHLWEEKIGLNYRFSSGPNSDQYSDIAALTGKSAPRAQPVKAPALSVYSWTGFYIGGNAGAVASIPSGTSDFLDSAAVPPFSSYPEQFSSANSSFLGGFQAGYNWQVDPRWVVGVEADWDWTRTRYNFCRQTDVTSSACIDDGSGFESIGSRTNWLGTARARAGVTLDGILLYGTGGAAWGRVVTTLSQSCLVSGCGSVSLLPLAASSTSTTDKMGWVAGVGAEYALSTNWSAKAEWLYIDLGTINNSLSTAGTFGLQTTTWSRSERYDELRIGVNYKFGH
jgi:opacity protein-like surface antigen